MFTHNVPCVTLTKRYIQVWGSGGTVKTPHNADVGCEKLHVKQKLPKFKLLKSAN